MLLTILSTVASIGTMLVMWLLSSQNRLGWKVSLANQALWLTIIYLTHAWGLLLLNGFMVYTAIRGLRRWR